VDARNEGGLEEGRRTETCSDVEENRNFRDSIGKRRMHLWLKVEKEMHRDRMGEKQHLKEKELGVSLSERNLIEMSGQKEMTAQLKVTFVKGHRIL
jgi:hypothetical protein